MQNIFIKINPTKINRSTTSASTAFQRFALYFCEYLTKK
jgi:hypothetical protein